MISGIPKVTLTTPDQEAAKSFWIDQIGFDLVQDDTYGDERWIEVAAPDGMRLVLAAGQPGTKGVGPPNLPTSNIFFTCKDILATHNEMVERGVEFHTAP
ncbi:MAG: VOC family protein [Egibacteraceae bacterium]